MSSEKLSRMTDGNRVALNNVSELFLQKASDDIVEGRLTDAVRTILLAIVSFDDCIDYKKYFTRLRKRMSREQFVRLLRTVVEQTSAISAKLTDLPEEAERLNRFGTPLTKCLAENGFSPEDMPRLRLPRGAVIYFKPFKTVKENTAQPDSANTAGAGETILSA